MSWLYALYCFDYKWSLHSVPLEARLRFFEQHWAFFAGEALALSHLRSLATNLCKLLGGWPAAFQELKAV